MSDTPPMFGIVYMTSRVLNGEVIKRYIGQHKLMHNQRDDYYIGSGILLTRAIRKYGRAVFVRETLEVCYSAEELFRAEEYWVKKYNAVNDPNFYNIAEGGKATVKKFKRRVFQYTLAGDFVAEYPSRVEASLKTGVEASALSSAVDVVGGSSGGFRWTSSKTEKLPPFVNQRNQPIDCFALSGTFLATFSSSVEAQRYAPQASKSNITACCKGKIKSAAGYQWRYAGQFKFLPEVTVMHGGFVRRVAQIDPATTKRVAEFKNFREAGEAVGCGGNSIRCALLTNTKAKGFKWVYA